MFWACTSKEVIQVIYQNKPQKQALLFFLEGFEYQDKIILSTQEQVMRSDAFQIHLFEDDKLIHLLIL